MPGLASLMVGDRRLDAGVDLDVALALAAEDAEGHDRLVVDAGEGFRLAPGIGHGGDVGQAHLAAARERDFQRRELARSMRAPPSVRIVWSRLAEIAAAAGHVDIGRAQRAVDVGGRDAERVQPVGLELDLDLARDAAIAVDARDALQALQLADDRVVDEPGQFLERHGRRRDGVGHDRLAFDVDAVDDRARRPSRAGRRGCARWRP